MMPGSKDKKPGGEQPPTVLNVTKEGLEAATGSTSSALQSQLLDQVTHALWFPKWKTVEEQVQAARAACDALRQIAPRTPLEGMLAAQMIPTHNAAMECLRRSMIESRTIEGREHNLKHGAKLMGLYERQLAALDKHRGKGQQKIIEHVTMEAGGQAIVGNVHTGQPAASGGTPTAPAIEDQSHIDQADLTPLAQVKRERARRKLREEGDE